MVVIFACVEQRACSVDSFRFRGAPAKALFCDSGFRWEAAGAPLVTRAAQRTHGTRHKHRSCHARRGRDLGMEGGEGREPSLTTLQVGAELGGPLF